MRLLTWNINSLRVRFERLLGVLERHDPDVVCLQETKVEDKAFPHAEIKRRGYHVAAHGQRGYNGVAILSKAPLEDVMPGFPGDPVGEARTIAATTHGVRVWSVYVVNGQSTDSPKFPRKLEWLEALAAALRDEPRPLVLAGDWNVAPDDRDLHDPALWIGHVHATADERTRLQAILDQGLTDLQRLHHQGPGPWTWWDYRALGFAKDRGMRIDLVLASQEVAAACTSAGVDRDERRQTIHPSVPSDHAPVVVDLDLHFEPDPPVAPPTTRPTTLGAFE